MDQARWGFFSIAMFILTLFAFASSASHDALSQHLTPIATPAGPIASQEQLDQAYVEWSQSTHADSFDGGMGANTTCARCKSPKNWDPSQDIAAMEALDCNACKRVPGAARPELQTGIPVSQEDWHSITCDICHIPAGDSYYVDIAFWNQATGNYEPVEDVLELCAKCHEGQHGFEVVEEQRTSTAHAAWDCTVCHGPHGAHSACEDCHNPAEGLGAAEHARHLAVNCAACHDAGRLSIWKETDPSSPHFGQFITIRFAHSLTSWPSHNLTATVSCERCHHPTTTNRAAVDPDTPCAACHTGGAMWIWCDFYPRDQDPLKISSGGY